MKVKGRKRFLWIGGGLVGGLLVLVVALALVLPHLLHLPSVREKILAQASRQVKGEVAFSKLDLSLFPVPRVIIHQVSVKFPGKGEVSADSFSLIPRLFPLLRGEVQVRHVKVSGPKAHVYLKKGKGGPSSSQGLEEKLKGFFALLSSRVPGLVIDVERGEIYIHKGGKKAALWIKDLKAHVVLPPQYLKMDVAFNSNMGKDFVLKGQLDPQSITGELKISLTQFQPHKLACCLLPLTPLTPVDSMMDMELALNLKGLKDVSGVFKGAVPCLALRKGKHALVMECGNLEGKFHLLGPKVEVSLAHMDLKYPQLHLSGSFLWDPQIPSARLVLEGRDVDILSLREVVLSLLGSDHTVNKIFGIVQGGRVPAISFRDTVPALSQLGSLKSMEIEGQVEGGTILIPGIHLKVEDTGGEVVISQGVLKGKHLVGNVGNSCLLQGKLSLGLKGKALPIHLDAELKADLAQLPRILTKIVKNKPFLSEMEKIQRLQGWARGRLVLDGTTEDISVSVKASDVNLKGVYGRIPYPVAITGGRFTYEASRAAVDNLKGEVGGSSFSDLSAWVDWKGVPLMRVSSMTARLLLDELYPWVFSYPQVKDALSDFKSMKGLLYVDALDLKGPPSAPEKWQFSLKGRVEGFLFGFSLFPSLLKVERGQVALTQDEISFQNCAALLEDASFHASGKLVSYKEGVKRLVLSMDGGAGVKALHWLYSFIELPQEYRLKPPVKAKGVHLVWERDGKTHLDGLLERAGIEASMDLDVLPKGFFIKKIDLEGKGIYCHLSVYLNGNSLDLAFKGMVNREILDRLLEKNTILKGWAKGDFRTRLLLNGRANFNAQGNLEVKGLTYLWGVKMPLNIEAASLEAEGERLTVHSARLGLGRSTVFLQGRVDSGDDTIHLSLGATAPSLDMKDIEEFVGTGEEGGEWTLPFDGDIRMKVTTFFYEGFTWSPIEGTVHLHPREVRVDVVGAHLCGISTPGVVIVVPGNTSFRFNFWAKEASWDRALTCLFQEEGVAKGKFDLQGRMKATGKEDPLAEHSTGEASLASGKGRIYRLTILSKIFSVLNVIEIFRGRLPDLTKEGFAYNSIKGKAQLKNGRLLVEQLVVDGKPMKIFGTGTVDLVKEKVDLTVLVAPLKTLDAILNRVPLVGWILTGKSKTFISIPLKVKGPLDDPKVIPINPSAVGSGILGVMKRTIQAPIQVIKPVLPEKGTSQQ